LRRDAVRFFFGAKGARKEKRSRSAGMMLQEETRKES